MKTKPEKFSEAAKARRLAESKVKICERVAQADQKQAHLAKARFKNAKKAWKLARKKAKRSAKLAKLANKNLTTLSKHLKRIKGKPPTAIKNNPAAKQKSKRSLNHPRHRELPVVVPAVVAGNNANPGDGVTA